MNPSKLTMILLQSNVLIRLFAYISSTCPIYTCTSSKEHCIKNTLNSTNTTINIELSQCKSNHQCIYSSDFWKHNNTLVKCSKIDTPSAKRLPGEPCEENSQCQSGDCDKDELRCVGKDLGEACQSDEQCLAGTFCHGNFTCVKQYELGEECTREHECVNHAFCHKDKCKLYYSLDAMESPDRDMFDKTMACRFNYMRSGDRCAQRKYIGEIVEGVVECSDGSKCRYDIGDNEQIEMDCVCGYNSNGKSYCPLDHFENSKVWVDYYVSLRNSFNNECHTKNRFYCKESSFDDSLTKRKLTQVQYHKAVECAESVLVSSMLRISLSAILLAILM